MASTNKLPNTGLNQWIKSDRPVMEDFNQMCIRDSGYTVSIDDDTYNFVKVAKDDKKAGVRDVYIAEDSANISRWGKLMIYDKVTAGLNAAQLQDLSLIHIFKRETGF